MLHVCGHIHDARGVERVRWSSSCASPLSEQSALGYAEYFEQWEDPGAGNKKLSFLDLSAKSRHPLDNKGCLAYTGNHVLPRDKTTNQNHLRKSSSRNKGDGRGLWRRTTNGAIEYRCGRTEKSSSKTPGIQRNDTVIINAAILGLSNTGKAMTLNKPIVVDIELPVWESHTSNDETRIPL